MRNLNYLTMLTLMLAIPRITVAQYCAASFTNTSDDWINNVTFGSINNTSGSTTYTDYTAQSTTVSAGNSYPISISVSTSGGPWDQYVSVWFDWNQDEVFQDATERTNLGFQGINNTSYTFNFTINVPANAVGGSTRMRVIERYNGYAPVGACNPMGTSYGEVEDYSVFVLSPLNVSTPDTLSTACFNDEDIDLFAYATGGTSPYTYSWSTGSTNDSIFNLGAGSYSVIVTDSLGATDTSHTFIIEPDSLYVTVDITQQILCEGDIGAATATATGGTPSYDYSWSNGSSTASVANLDSGINTVVVTDDSGCVASAQIVIDSAQSNMISNPSVMSVLCFGGNSGSIDPDISGGVAPYNYSWSTGDSVSVLTNLEAGIYTVTITDSLGCMHSLSQTISEPPILTLNASLVDSIVCEGDSTGTASAVAGGGVSPYQISWQPSGTIGGSATGLWEGNHQVMVTDSNGCEMDTSITFVAISPNPEVDLGPDIFDTLGMSHTLDAGMHSSYTWGGSGSGSNSTLVVTTTGTYSVTVTNEYGCEGSDEIYVDITKAGIEDVVDFQILMYPNPVSSILNVEFGRNMANAAIRLTDVNGATIHTSTLRSTNTLTLDMADLPSGVYALSVIKGKAAATHRIVKL
ncbi:MAG: hypothetical protein Salg2KO_04000 [Salibacteraceae bacterium]